jgi:deoxyribonuclease IV
MKNESKLNLGAHVSISGGIYKALERGKLLSCDNIQIFTKNNNQWNSRPIKQDDLMLFKSLIKETGIYPVIAHSSYLINLASKENDILNKSIYSLIDEIKRCSILGIKYLVVHPGHHGGAGINNGIKIISESINTAYKEAKYPDVSITLETTAGQGTSIGSKFEELSMIIELLDKEIKPKICIDFAHIFEAGYKISSKIDYKKSMKDLDNIIGYDKVSVFHVNDSKTNNNSKVDRHEHIGKGKIGLKAFSYLMNDKNFFNIPKIIETPKSEDLHEDVENLTLLRNLYRIID